MVLTCSQGREPLSSGILDKQDRSLVVAQHVDSEIEEFNSKTAVSGVTEGRGLNTHSLGSKSLEGT